MIRGGSIQKIEVPNHPIAYLEAVSPDGKVMCFAVGPKAASTVILSGGQLKEMGNVVVWSINDAGHALFIKPDSLKPVFFLRGDQVTEIDIGAALGKPVELASQYWLNNNDIIAGSYRDQTSTGVFVIADNKPFDLMTQPSVAQYDFSQAVVMGFNDANQILI